MLLDDILGANSRYSIKAAEALEPKALVIACMDPRLNMEILTSMGLKSGDAVILRNAGNIVTDDTVRSSIIAITRFGVKEIIILGHTDCAMSKLNISEFLNALSALGVHRNAITVPDIREWLGGFINETENVKKQVEALRSSPLMPSGIKIHGLMMDINTGKIEVVIDGYKAPEERPARKGQVIDTGKSTLFDSRRTERDKGPVIQETAIGTPDFTHYEMEVTSGTVPVTQNINLSTIDEVPLTGGTALKTAYKDVTQPSDTDAPEKHEKHVEHRALRNREPFSQVAEVPQEYAATVDAIHDALPDRYQVTIDNLGYDARTVLKQLKRLTGKDYSLYTAVGVPILKNLSKDRADKIKRGNAARGLWELLSTG